MTPRLYYVTARDGPRVAFLDGPHETHEAALARVRQCARWASDRFPSGPFATYGTSSLPADVTPPKTRYPPGVPTLEPHCGSWVCDGREFFDPEPVAALVAQGHTAKTTLQHLQAQ